MRKGIVPFHAWVPEVFDHGRLGPAILFNAPQGLQGKDLAGRALTVNEAKPREPRREPSRSHW